VASSGLPQPPPPSPPPTSPPAPPAPPAPGPDRFLDSAASYAHDAIEELAARGITSGCAAELYCTTALVSRGDFALLLCGVLGIKPGATPDAFSDDGGMYFEGCLDALAGAGLVTGTAPRTFSPHAPLDRAAVAVMLVGAGAYRRGAPWTGPWPAPFVDIAASYARDAVGALVGMGVTAGVDPTHYGPAVLVTREQVAVFLIALENVPAA